MEKEIDEKEIDEKEIDEKIEKEIDEKIEKVNNSDTICNSIIKLYTEYGHSDYIGENITQLEHALQCMNLALYDTRLNGCNEYIKKCVVISAFLHDIGHLVGLEQKNKGFAELEMRDSNVLNGMSLGFVGHEGLGWSYLKNLGFPPLICELVYSHVMAKRYLCSIKKSYYDNLSNASKETFKMQGGLLTKFEIDKFRNSEYSDYKIMLREYDDNAKVKYVSINTNKYFTILKDYIQTILFFNK